MLWLVGPYVPWGYVYGYGWLRLQYDPNYRVHAGNYAQHGPYTRYTRIAYVHPPSEKDEH